LEVRLPAVGNLCSVVLRTDLPGPVCLTARPGETWTARGTSRWAEPCPGSGSLPLCRLNDENSRWKVQNVRADSSANCPATCEGVDGDFQISE
jgi:hypothetical protein